MSLTDLLFRKAPRSKATCNYCDGGFGLARPNWPFCTRRCKESFDKAVFRPPDQFELPLHKPPDVAADELVKLLQYP